MRKAPYVRGKMVNGTRVWFVRPTPALNKVFPDLKIIPSLTEPPLTLREANDIGDTWSKDLARYAEGGINTTHVTPHSVQSLVNYYKNSMSFRSSDRNSGITDSTRRSYLHHLNYLMQLSVNGTRFDAMHVSDVDFEFAEQMWLYIQNDISTHKANHCVKVLKLIWARGIQSKEKTGVKANVWREIKLPKLPDRRVMWSMEQMRGLIDYCDEQGYASMGSMITMCFEFCQRPVDIRKFKWSYIDGKTGVSNFMQRKTKQRMALSMTNAVEHRLEKHARRNLDDYIFAYENTGQPYTADSLNKVFRKLARGYGLPEVALLDQYNVDGSQMFSSIWMADLRRTGATHASRAGCTDRELMALTGHRNPSMLVVYAVEGEIESGNAQAKRSKYSKQYDVGLLHADKPIRDITPKQVKSISDTALAKREAFGSLLYAGEGQRR